MYHSQALAQASPPYKNLPVTNEITLIHKKEPALIKLTQWVYSSMPAQTPKLCFQFLTEGAI